MTPFGAHGQMPHSTCGALFGPIGPKASQRAMDTAYEFSSAPIVLCCAGHLGTLSQIHSMELFQTTTNAYI
jgi:hypothetical protein